MICLGSKAQTTFEGELHYRNFENYSRNARMFTGGEFYNGARNLRIILKEGKALIIDETLNVYRLALPEKEEMIVFSPLTKSGIIKSLYIDEDTIKAELNAVGASLSSSMKKYKDKECLVYKGEIKPSDSNYNNSSLYEVWCSKEYLIPSYMNSIILQKIKIPYIPVKWTFEKHGKQPIFGKTDVFIASELMDIIPRRVEDSEFDIPKGYKYITTDSQMKLAGFYKDVCKILRKQNKYPGDADADTEVTYKIDDEWDF